MPLRGGARADRPRHRGPARDRLHDRGAGGRLNTDEVRAALGTPGAAVLVAPPGTGKTTTVPPALLDEPWAAGRRLLLVEPRRLAVRAAARRIAELRGERVGDTVGFSVRGERRVGRGTRLEVLTEGLLVRRLQADPSLEGVAGVVLDEFHERSLDLDLALALLLDARAGLRPDLRLLVMSATLDPVGVAGLLGAPDGAAPVVRVDAPTHPVRTRYRPGSAHDRIEDRTAAVVREALAADPGDVLVFLPGRGEIRRTASRLAGLGDGVVLHELHGSVPGRDQDAALTPDPAGRRKVVLSTSVAETSVTVPGVRVVVDSGRRRTNRVDPATGLPGLVTGPVSASGADQRRGRAGRTAPGVCYRLWAEADERHRPAADVPEVVDGDLSPLVVQVASWGAAIEDLRWLDPPGGPHLRAARELLRDLGALDAEGRTTPTGRRLADLGFHPRLGAVVIGAGGGATAAALAAVLETDRPGDPDVVQRVRDVWSGRAPDEVRRAAADWRRRLGTGSGDDRSPEELEALVVTALVAGFRDRLARRREGHRSDERGRAQRVHQLVNGGEVAVRDAEHPLARAEWLVVAALDRGAPGRPGVVHLAAPVPAELALATLADRVAVEHVVTWDRARRRVVASVRRAVGAVTLGTTTWADPPADRVRAALAEGLAVEGAALFLRWSEAEQLRARWALLAGADVASPDPDGWPDPDAADGTGWAAPLLDRAVAAARGGVPGPDDLARVDVAAVLADATSWPARRALEELAPMRIDLPSGGTAAVTYERHDDAVRPVASVRLQDLLGVDVHPTVAAGRVPVVLELLSPAGRPLQTTTDLPGFWRGSYAAVRSEMRGRYPKHAWPERPWEPVSAPGPGRHGGRRPRRP